MKQNSFVVTLLVSSISFVSSHAMATKPTTCVLSAAGVTKIFDLRPKETTAQGCSYSGCYEVPVSLYSSSLELGSHYAPSLWVESDYLRDGEEKLLQRVKFSVSHASIFGTEEFKKANPFADLRKLRSGAAFSVTVQELQDPRLKFSKDFTFFSIPEGSLELSKVEELRGNLECSGR